MNSRPIATLPVELRSVIRSTTIVTSLPQIIAELMQNSLDAGASHVDVGVDVEGWQCWVRDDGNGMGRAGMSILAKGSEEGRYGTSKAYDPASLGNISTFGFRGEALASAADLSCLEICSRTSTSRETWSVILKGGKKLYYGAAVRWRREKPGTTVCIRDAFYNLPIRRLSHPNPSRTLEHIRKDLESVALVFPNVAFSLENSAKEKGEGSGKGRIMTIPKTPSSLAAFRHMFGRALCEHVDEINVSMDDMRVQGFLSLDGAHSKAHQYLYVNRHPLSPCDIHRVIDTRFAASSFGKHAFDEAGETRLPRSVVRRSPRKNERRPVYVLNITIPPHSIDNCLEPAKAIMHFENPDAVSSFVSSVIQSFLVRHGFSSNNSKANARTPSNSPSPKKKRRIAIENGGTNCQASPSTTGTRVAQALDSRPASRASMRQSQGVTPTVDPSSENTQELTWVDPSTGQAYMVNPQTGNSYLKNASKDMHNDSSMNGDYAGKIGIQRSLVDTSRLRKTTEACHGDEAVPNWITQALDGWQNPTFGLQEPGVPSLTSLSSSSRQPWLQLQPKLGQQSGKHSRFFDVNLTAGRKHNATDASKSFDRAQLKCAEVIGQVDRKFVACLIEDGAEESKTLVLVDQHAADERIRVERLLSDLCQGFLDHDRAAGVEIQEMQPAVPILLTRSEARALSSSDVFRHAFARWGFRFEPMLDSPTTEEDTGEDEYVQIFLKAIPDVVSEKLLQGDELRELVKGFLAKLEIDGAAYDATDSSNPSANRWITALRWCPRELLDLVNSKACRGAIMFNDTLDIDQCRRLISQVSETVWPFICAHGRPSVVPLTNVEWSGKERRSIDWSNLKRRE